MPKNMKYDATTKKAGASKKMKSNQDGGSVTAKDPAAAGKQLAANQAGAAKYKEGPAQRQRINNQTATKEGKDMVPDKMLKRGDVRADGSIVGETMNKNKGVGPSRMGYSQKFGPGRMNGYDAGAKKVMDVMTYGGASKYMGEGPGQMQFLKKLGRTVTRGLGDIAMQASDFIMPDRHRAINKDPRAKQNAYRSKLDENAHYDRSRELAATNQTFGTLANYFDDDGLGNPRTGVRTDYKEDVREKNEAYKKSKNK